MFPDQALLAALFNMVPMSSARWEYVQTKTPGILQCRAFNRVTSSASDQLNVTE
jgi:hypothetical protein